jgi:hypothetical protein
VNTLSEAIDEFVEQGFTATFEAHDVVIRGFERFEGISDPDDMSIVYAMETKSGMRGTLADAFGVYANPVISAFVDEVAIAATSEQPRTRR